MITALLSFLGGNVFRMIFGEIISAWNKKQEHDQEIMLMRLQSELDDKAHARNMEALKTTAEMGMKTVQVQAEAAIDEIEADGWRSAVKATAIKTGLLWVDAWNAVIRPAVATWAIFMITLHEFGAIVMSENTIALSGAALGIYLADRSLFKRGK